VTEPKFNPLAVLQENGGYMKFWNLVRTTARRSHTDDETAYNRIMQLIGAGRIRKVVVRRTKCYSRSLSKLIPGFSST